jgi:hypothetical protein
MEPRVVIVVTEVSALKIGKNAALIRRVDPHVEELARQQRRHRARRQIPHHGDRKGGRGVGGKDFEQNFKAGRFRAALNFFALGATRRARPARKPFRSSKRADDSRAGSPIVRKRRARSRKMVERKQIRSKIK